MRFVLPRIPTQHEASQLHAAPAAVQRIDRLRVWLLGAIVIAGMFWPFRSAARPHAGSAWLYLSGLVARDTVLGVAQASIVVMALAICLAVSAALLRTFASAHAKPSGSPRNLGNWLNVVALSILMPPGGALFAVLSSAILSAAAIVRSPFASSVAASSGEHRPKWLRALLRELYPWGVAVTYAAFASRYNTTVLEQGVLISLGIGIIARSLVQPVG